MLEIPIVTRIIDMKRRKEDERKETTQEGTRTWGYSLKAAIDKKSEKKNRGNARTTVPGSTLPELSCAFAMLCHHFACISADRSLVPSKRAEHVPYTKMIQDANANAKVGYHPGLPQRNKVYVLPKPCDQH